MTQTTSRKGPPPVVYTLGLLALGGLGYFAYQTFKPPAGEANSPAGPKVIQAPNNTESEAIVKQRISLKVDGSTAMVGLNKSVKDKFGSGSSIVLSANGTDNGLKALKAGEIDLAAASRPLTAEEKSQGLIETTVGQDTIAFVVGLNNKIDDVSLEDLKTLFCKPSAVSIINRPVGSATRKTVEQALGCSLVGRSLSKDGTTEMLGLLKNNAIGYASWSQVKDQQTVKVLRVDSAIPQDENYPNALKRPLVYVTKGEPTDHAASFLKVAAHLSQ
jgi:phosphate transport system substrate-binding protein